MIPSLDRLAEASRRRAAEAMRREPLAVHEEIIEALPPVRSLRKRLEPEAGPPPRVVAEMRPASPGGPASGRGYDPRRISLGYARVGAAAVAVVTEPDEHGGALSHVAEARAAHVPVVRSDILVTPYQVAESRTAGADAVLLMARMLPGPGLGLMLHAATRYAMEAIVAVADEEDLRRAVGEGAALVVVGGAGPGAAKDLPDAREKLAIGLQGGVLGVAGGGIRDAAEVTRLAGAGYEAFWIGEGLAGSPDPGDALWSLLGGT